MENSTWKKMRFITQLSILTIFAIFNTSCTRTPEEDRLAEEIILYDWDGDIPQTVLDSFTAEYGVRVHFETYTSQEEAIENMQAGQVYDVVVMENRFIPSLIDSGMLAKINFENVLNFKNISPNFRGLLYDPNNQYCIPYSWGTTGLVARTDLLQEPVQRWSDLWDARYADKVAIWAGQPREVVALTLKSLGFSANSENPAELEAALEQLIALKPHLRFLEDYDSEYAVPAFQSGDVVIAMGYAGDILAGSEAELDVEFIVPEDGALLWGDNFVIPSNSPRKYTAEVFLNFLLRPEIGAEITNQTFYASVNEAARPFINPDIINNPAIFPDETVLKNAEIILPLSPDGQQLYNQTWQRFLEADPK